jgi:low affinity Fe/Cu permease
VKDRRRSTWASEWLHAVGEWSGRAWLALVLSIATLVVVVCALLLDAASAWLTAFAAVVQAVTLVMVFVVQHTQDHDQKVTHRKLDALIAALPDAEADLLHLETASDARIDALDAAHRARGQKARSRR